MGLSLDNTFLVIFPTILPGINAEVTADASNSLFMPLMMFCDSLAEVILFWVIIPFGGFGTKNFLSTNLLYFWALIFSAGLTGSAAGKGFLNMPAGTAQLSFILSVVLTF